MPTFSLPQRNPVKESGRSRLAAATHGAVPAVAEAERGDTRRMTRGVELATALAQQPTAAVPEAGGP
ncbi:MAG: transposase DNA-binding-containing protein, partial [Candidatus Entotheonellia bacterium]